MNWQDSWRDTPVWINNFNNLDRGFRDLIDWLRRAGMRKIGDHRQPKPWPPLLRYYETLHDVQIVHAHANLGHGAFWRLDLHLPPTTPVGSRYILSDPDVVPDPNCPFDLVRKMHEVADRFPGGAKVGPAIRIDNLPETFALRDHMRFCESDYWVRKYPEGDSWNAAIDTVFAIYESGWTRWPLAEQGGVPHARLDFPYVVEHRPWYTDSANPSEEELYYRAHADPAFSSSLTALEAADVK